MCNTNYERLRCLFEGCDDAEVDAILKRNNEIANAERAYVNTLPREQLVEEYISSSEYHLAKQSIAYAQLVKLNSELAEKDALIKGYEEKIARVMKFAPNLLK